MRILFGLLIALSASAQMLTPIVADTHHSSGGGYTGPTLTAHTITDPANTYPSTSSAINCTGANLLLAPASNFATGASTVISDSSSNTWAYGTLAGSASDTARTAYVQGATVSASQTATMSGIASFGAFGFSCWTGAATSGGPDQHAENFVATTTTIQAGSITPSTNNQLIISVLSTECTTTPTIDGGFTRLDTVLDASSVGLSIAYLEQSTAAAVNPTWTCGAAKNMAVSNMSFK